MPRVGAHLEFGDQRGQVEVGAQRDLFIDEVGERNEGLPAFAGAHTGGGFGGQAERFEQRAHRLRQRPFSTAIGSTLPTGR